MQLEVNNGSMNVVFDVAEIRADVGQSAQLDVQQAINYIKSGEAEIASYVNGTAKPAIDAYVVSNAYPAISAYVVSNAEPAIDSYVTNTAEPVIDAYVTNTALPQVNTYVDLAKDWATKTDGMVDGNEYSAKYYANQAAATLSSLADVAFSGSYTDLTDKPTIGNATLTIQKNGSNVDTFTANATVNKTINITVPTNNNELLNGAGYITQTTADSRYARLAGVNTFTGTVNVPDVNIIAAPGAYAANTKYVYDYVGTSVLHLYSHGSEIGRFSANATSDVTIDLNIPTRVSQLTDADAYATQVWVSATYAPKSYVDNADNNLQSQIDAITAASDVTDIVGTYAELQAYDTTSLPNNSIIKVLQDESRNNETTYYRWVITGGAGAWSLIGEEGPYYTISAADAKFATQTALTTGLAAKQDVISDLTTIRSGAALGATAVQPNDLDDYATTQYVDDELSEKQDTLTAGANIQIVGNTISATDTTYTAGNGISIISNVISNTQTSAEWGNITGTLSAQTDLWNILNAKANVADIPTTTSDLTNDSGFITSAALTPYVLASSLATVATSGSYTDLSNKPTIPAAQVNSDWNAVSGVAQILNKPTIPVVPTNVSAFTNDSGYITSSALTGYATESYVTTATANMQTTGNLVTSISSASTDTQYPSAKCVYDIVGDIETIINTIRGV